MKRTIFLISFFFYLSQLVNAQYIQDGSKIRQTDKHPGKYGDIFVEYQGVAGDGFLKYPESIIVNCKELINGKKVDVKYRLTPPGNFVFKKNRENLVFPSNVKDKLTVGGFILQGEEGSEDTLATFKEIIYTSNPARFTGWIVSMDSKLGTTNTTSLSNSGLHSSCDDFKFQGKKVAFFRIEKDFTLSFVANPISLIPKPSTNTIKK
jgi:hypothetical protein